MSAQNSKPFNRVLIIDDDRVSIFLTKIIIEEMELAEQILTVSNGEQGLEIIKKHCLNEHAAKKECPDLILLDINMPVMDGLEVLEQLHQIGQDNLIEAKIVVLTSSDHVQDRYQMDRFGVRHYMEKPVSEEKILSLLQIP